MSPPWKFKITWDHTCSFCKHPLDIIIYLEYDANQNKLFWKRYYNFTMLLPSDVHLNKMYIKIVNLKARRVCKWCYDNKVHNVGFRNILNREVTGRSPAPRSRSLSCQEVYNWFESFDRYLRRPDADEYVVKSS